MPEDPSTNPSTSRRRFLIGAGAGAGASVLAAASGTVAEAAAAGTESPDEGAAAAGTLVAYVSDVASGEISVMADGREVTVTDPALARSLARKVR